MIFLSVLFFTITTITHATPSMISKDKNEPIFTTTRKSTPPSGNQCANYKALTAFDRQMISDTRFALENIKPNLSENEINSKLQVVLNKYSPYFKRDPLPNHLQGLMAEFFLKRLIHKSIGVENLAYRKFTIFIDLILYHRAMNNLGFVNEADFLVAKKNLEQEIINFYKERQQLIVNLFKTEQTQVFSALYNNNPISTILTQKANDYIEMENSKAQILGSIELIWSQLLNRNQQNRMESMAQTAVIDMTINTAAAATGLASMLKIALGMTFTAQTGAYGLISTANSLWSLSFQAAIGCGIGLTAKTTLGVFTSSYLDSTKALYASLQNKTSFACELGEMMNKNNKFSAREIIIPHTNPDPSNAKDYLITCATTAAMRLFPTTAGIAIDGLAFTSLAMVSYNLANEAYIVISEIPRLYELKNQAKASAAHDPKTLMDIQEKIQVSEAKIALYLSAMGHNTILAVRNGFFLYLHRGNIAQAVANARSFLNLQSTKNVNVKAPELATLKFVVDKLN